MNECLQGGAGSTGRRRLLEVQPENPYQRVPDILGSKEEGERMARYHLDPGGDGNCRVA